MTKAETWTSPAHSLQSVLWRLAEALTLVAELTSSDRLVDVSAPVFDAEQPPDGSVVLPIWEQPYVVT